MTSGGWHSQEQRHGRHRRGATGAAWTPAVRPTDTGPVHARQDGVAAFRPSDTGSRPAWPASEVLTRGPDRPVEPEVPAARRATHSGQFAAAPANRAPAWPTEDTTPPPPRRAVRGDRAAAAPAPRNEAPPDFFRRQNDAGEPVRMSAGSCPDLFRRSDGLVPIPTMNGTTSGEPAPARPSESTGESSGVPSFLREPIAGDAVVPAALRRRRHAAGPGKRRTISADMVLDTAPMGRVRHRRGETGPLAAAIVHTLPPETPATGLRKFDLGTVPASVTPPRSWRKAAWFAVGTSAAVVLGLTVATAELMGGSPEDGVIDALPAYPTGPLTLDELPNEATTAAPDRPVTSTRRSSPRTAAPTDGQAEPPRDTVVGSTGETTDDGGTGTSGRPSQQAPAPTTETTPQEPTRRTVGAQPLVVTDTEAMGDRTEQYFELVTTDPAAAHELTTGGMAREGAEGIEARYDGVERVEVQEITIDRGAGVTTARVKVVREDGTETIEKRQLTFTWGSDPKIKEETTTA